MYYPLFDWLRIILASIVLLSHDGVLQWHYAGDLAVQVFFALSGWLIGGILLSSKKEDLPRFFFNRVTRIWVPYAIAIGLLLCASLLRDPVTPKWLEFVFYKVTFVYNLFGSTQRAQSQDLMPLEGTGNHFWSICAEEQFYLFAPVVLLLLPARFGKSIILWAMLSLLAIKFNFYASIALGVSAAVIKERFFDWHLGKAPILILFFVIILLAVVMYFQKAYYFFVAPWFAISTILLLARPGKKTTWGQFWGGVSYPFYLNHWIGIFVAHELLEPFGLREADVSKVMAFLVNILVASILYIVVDRTMLRDRRAWFNERRGKSAAIAAYSLLIIGLAGGGFLLISPIS